jgi:hypothetical protein
MTSDEMTDAELALHSAWRNGVPLEAAALYARWWQLETWLRELLYVELYAKYGLEWQGQLPGSAERYARTDRRYSYMDTPDASVRLAYLDVGGLLDLIEGNWDLVSHGLLGELDIWKGRMSELNKVRRRIAHCRRPHTDDLRRLEQTLRDIDPAAHAAIAAFNRPSWIWGPQDHADPLLKAWIDLEHGAAHRLVRHCEDHYDIRFRLHYSRRPWAQPIGVDDEVTGQSGYLWHATWTLGQGPGNARTLWEDGLVAKHHSRIVFLLADQYSFEFSFSAVNQPDVLADAIGDIFDAVVYNRHPPLGYRESERLGDPDQWVSLHRDLDWRVHIDSAWNVITEDTPASIFGVR